jgi:valyl-tRNA synthetase
MPFITEEIWQILGERTDGESLMISLMPEPSEFNRIVYERFEVAKETISAVRTVRKSKEIPLKEKLELLIYTSDKSYDSTYLPVIEKLCNLSGISFVTEKQEGAVSFLVRTTEYFIPLGDKIDIEGELTKIAADLEYHRGFLVSVMKKLDNARFVQSAPATVLEMERKKKSDAESKIRSLEARREELNKI